MSALLLIHELVEGAWARWLRSHGRNAPMLHKGTHLHAFLFESDRQALARLAPHLLELQSGSCFYCQRRLFESSHVDHFVPRSLYHVDLGHNFVLAHAGCNESKGNTLADVAHLERWCERNAVHARELSQACAEHGIEQSLATSVRVGHWAYSQADSMKAQVWQARAGNKPVLVRLDPAWRTLLG